MKSPASEVQLIEPLGVATRQSTDAVAIDDPDIAALRYIREYACRGITVAEVVRDNSAAVRLSDR